MLKKCCGCGRKDSHAEDDEEDEEDDVTSKIPDGEEEKDAVDDSTKKGVLKEKEEDNTDDKEVSFQNGVAKSRNALGLTVDASVEAELQELGMDPSVLLEPLTPRSLITSSGTPYPGKRSSVVLASAGALWSSSVDSDTALTPPSDGLPMPSCPREMDGTLEPPATPVGRDELAMRRHRFFSDLLTAAQAAAEHRVRFDPLGPKVAGEEDTHSPQLETLLSRLETVTTRLEETVKVVTLAPGSNPAPPPPASAPQPPASACGSASSSMSVSAYQDIIAGPLALYLGVSAQIGGDVATHANLVREAFQNQAQFLGVAASHARPSQTELMSLLQPTSLKIQAIQEFREKNRQSALFNHLSAVSEAIPALGWVALSATPAPYVKEMRDAGQFYTNRVLKDWKEKDKRHVEWVNSWVQVLTDLQAFVKQHHTTGLVWSAKGGAGAPPPPPPAAMPPPPPVLPAGDLANLSLDNSHDRSALFAEINQGENITRSLKKVTSEMQTHKNPSLRSGPAPFKTPEGKTSSGTPTAPVDKPPQFTRDGKKWIIEYQKGNKNLVVEGAEMNNVVYVFKCVDSTLIVKGKINSIVMDSCKKSAVVFDSLVSSVEFVNCQSVQMQVNGVVPTITIDKTDGCQMYLSNESLNVEIVSSKSSEMNVLIPSPSGDYNEYPIPEQYRTKVSRTGLTTTVVESLG